MRLSALHALSVLVKAILSVSVIQTPRHWGNVALILYGFTFTSISPSPWMLYISLLCAILGKRTRNKVKNNTYTDLFSMHPCCGNGIYPMSYVASESQTRLLVCNIKWWDIRCFPKPALCVIFEREGWFFVCLLYCSLVLVIPSNSLFFLEGGGSFDLVSVWLNVTGCGHLISTPFLKQRPDSWGMLLLPPIG